MDQIAIFEIIEYNQHKLLLIYLLLFPKNGSALSDSEMAQNGCNAHAVTI